MNNLDYYGAIQRLNTNFIIRIGIIYKKDKDYLPSEKEWRAIDYLCEQEDYSYNNKSIKDIKK